MVVLQSVFLAVAMGILATIAVISFYRRPGRKFVWIVIGAAVFLTLDASWSPIAFASVASGYLLGIYSGILWIDWSLGIHDFRSRRTQVRHSR